MARTTPAPGSKNSGNTGAARRAKRLAAAQAARLAIASQPPKVSLLKVATPTTTKPKQPTGSGSTKPRKQTTSKPAQAAIPAPRPARTIVIEVPKPVSPAEGLAAMARMASKRQSVA